MQDGAFVLCRLISLKAVVPLRLCCCLLGCCSNGFYRAECSLVFSRKKNTKTCFLLYHCTKEKQKVVVVVMVVFKILFSLLITGERK